MSRRRAVLLAWLPLVLGLSATAPAGAELPQGDGMGIITAWQPGRATVVLGESEVVPLSPEAARQLSDYLKQAGWPTGTKLLAKFEVYGGVIQSILVEGRLEP